MQVVLLATFVGLDMEDIMRLSDSEREMNCMSRIFAFSGCVADGAAFMTLVEAECLWLRLKLESRLLEGDCYLVLDTFMADGRIRHHIHFWLGKDTSADEAGSVAIFAAQLDESLGGGPIQFRQPQGSESTEFLRLFPRLKYMAGGYASGFRDAAKGPRGAPGPVRLYQIKSASKTCVQVFEVPCCLASLNHGDCFLLEDVGARLLWVWHGSAANIREKTRAIEAGNAFKEGTGIRLSVLDDGDDVSNEAVAFFSRLGCPQPPKPGEIREPEGDKVRPAAMQPPQLFKVVNGGNGFLHLCTKEGAPLSASLLDPRGQFVLLAAGCIWVWTGAECGADGKEKPIPPLQVGSSFAASQGLPAVIKAVKARFEPGLFTTYFSDWGADGRTTGTPGKDSFGNVIPGPGKGTDDQPYNAEEAAAAMVAMVAAADAAATPVSDQAAALEAAYGSFTSSKIQVWAMIAASSLELPRQEMGQFYDGASYVVLHSYSTSRDPSDLRYAVYVWQGRHCGNLEQGAAALMAADLHKSRYSGRCTLVRVEQGLEPGHFVRLFKGTMVVRRGPRPAHQAPGRSPPGVHLYQVKGEAVALAHAVEVAASASSLCGNDCFVLERASEVGATTTEPVLLWQGAASTEVERQVAAAVAEVLASAPSGVQSVEEGREPESFWAALGGKADYGAPSAGAPGARAGLKVQLLTTFSQDCLNNDDVMLLDTGSELYVWYGSSCKHTERPRGRDVAQRYLAACGRSGAASLVEVESGQEPPFFTCHFVGWDKEAVTTIPDVYADKLRAMALEKAAKDAAAQEAKEEAK
ncbi:actin-binding protein gelsolin [Volvox carteri f. nagariensis]|uniref:Actin-binding protein gelsolin n=1 Tax=Volvox carteri f. nagariensis TaxID=3068 RepID=D8UJD7_VOLCA|nr:actin-binding protein gelsolin [Volvox carteri f. nagariensis]EFJ40169.1 actin-binding protein gelsolin [Volvox carteri f. nagariensis]|eukprot:XP_002958779.1 actin-binding protein gelsolin [Volvox carteri f. nagariensis]